MSSQDSPRTSPEARTAQKAATAPDPNHPDKPDSPTEIHKPSWKYLAKKSWHEFNRDQCTDLAAALTYYSVLAIFPALLALISLLGIFGQGQSTVTGALDALSTVVPSDSLSTIRPILEEMVKTNAAGFALVTGLLGALWSASGYVGAFARAMNRIYEVDEGRPVWKLRPQQLGITLILLLGAALVAVGLVVSGDVARVIGSTIGLGDQAVTIWNYAKLPVMLIIVVGMVALLYWATPNVRQPSFRWISLGATVAILIWILASAGFGFYVANFGSYNKTYGALAGVIVTLLWLWITNLALLLGAELDCELERARQLQTGIRAEETLQLPPREASGVEKKVEKREELVQEGRLIRLDAEKSGATPPSESSDSSASTSASRSED